MNKPYHQLLHFQRYLIHSMGESLRALQDKQEGKFTKNAVKSPRVQFMSSYLLYRLIETSDNNADLAMKKLTDVMKTAEEVRFGQYSAAEFEAELPEELTSLFQGLTTAIQHVDKVGSRALYAEAKEKNAHRPRSLAAPTVNHITRRKVFFGAFAGLVGGPPARGDLKPYPVNDAVCGAGLGFVFDKLSEKYLPGLDKAEFSRLIEALADHYNVLRNMDFTEKFSAWQADQARIQFNMKGFGSFYEAVEALDDNRPQKEAVRLREILTPIDTGFMNDEDLPNRSAKLMVQLEAKLDQQRELPRILDHIESQLSMHARTQGPEEQAYENLKLLRETVDRWCQQTRELAQTCRFMAEHGVALRPIPAPAIARA